MDYFAIVNFMISEFIKTNLLLFLLQKTNQPKICRPLFLFLAYHDYTIHPGSLKSYASITAEYFFSYLQTMIAIKQNCLYWETSHFGNHISNTEIQWK